MTLPFEKWQGLGNDFVVLDADVWQRAAGGPEVARAICDRHFGVGADGVLVVGRRERIPSMTVWNADGSRPEMCGNGLRCVAARHGSGTFEVATDAGTYTCTVERGEVTIPMGTVRTPEPASLTLEAGDRSFVVHRANIGNPHAIAVVDDDPERLCHTYGPILTTHVAFPEGANIEFVSVRSPVAVRLHVWERGAGPTLACGTGACATVATLVRLGLCTADTEVEVTLPGGALHVTSDTSGTTQMRGPAVRVFSGELTL